MEMTWNRKVLKIYSCFRRTFRYFTSAKHELLKYKHEAVVLARSLGVEHDGINPCYAQQNAITHYIKWTLSAVPFACVALFFLFFCGSLTLEMENSNGGEDVV